MANLLEKHDYCRVCGRSIRAGYRLCGLCWERMGRREADAVDHLQAGLCANCGQPLAANEKYCSVCGTPKNLGAFQPEPEPIQCLYGPPVLKWRFRCTCCGNCWESVRMWAEPDEPCPKCGGPGQCQGEARPLY